MFCPTVKFWVDFISLTYHSVFYPLQEKCSHMGIGKRWKSEGVHFGVLSSSGIVFWGLLEKRVKKLVEKSIPFFWTFTYGTMPVITGKTWKEFHFIVHVAYITDPKCNLTQGKLLAFLYHIIICTILCCY